MTRIVRVSIADEKGQEQARDALVWPDNQELERISFPLVVRGWRSRTFEVVIEFDPPATPRTEPKP